MYPSLSQPLMRPSTSETVRPVGSDSPVYDPPFWFAYVANSSLMVAVSVLFRYADFVQYLGGTEWQLGLITGTGMIGSIVMRTFQGVGVDRFGPRRVWLVSLVMLIIATTAHLGVHDVGAPAVYLLRILFATGIAGAFGASITYVSLRAPPQRMAEMIGMLGTSGFVGMSLGPILGDLLLDVPRLARTHVDRMFLVAAAMCAVSLGFAALATRRERAYRGRRRPPLVYLVRRYHPGTILLVGMAMGLGLGLPHTFLRTYTAQLNIGRMKVFFLVYAVAAFIVRIATRRLADRWGVRPVIHLGLGSLAATMVLFLAVRSEWMLAIPAATGGAAHALLFPAVVAGANTRFPRRYRGLATALIMAMFDVGNLFGQPLVGAIIDLAKPLGLPPYGTMFLTVAAAMVAVSMIYGGSARTGD